MVNGKVEFKVIYITHLANNRLTHLWQFGFHALLILLVERTLYTGVNNSEPLKVLLIVTVQIILLIMSSLNSFQISSFCLRWHALSTVSS